jgi:hypothetical protein
LPRRAGGYIAARAADDASGDLYVLDADDPDIPEKYTFTMVRETTPAIAPAPAPGSAATSAATNDPTLRSGPHAGVP